MGNDPWGRDRPKGSQKGVVKRSHQKGPLNMSSTAGGAGGCLMSLLLLPALPVLALVRVWLESPDKPKPPKK